jgi:hypothetical protein
MRVALLIFALPMLLGGPSAWAQGTGGGRFDGRWAVVLECPQAPDGALPFTFHFMADVAGGTLHGQYGTPGQPASLSLDGPIQPSGAAQLKARGLTGQSAYNINQTTRGVPYQYDVDAHFAGAQGTGSWVAKRTCTFSFTKQ